jgi:hypothetical protein
MKSALHRIAASSKRRELEASEAAAAARYDPAPEEAASREQDAAAAALGPDVEAAFGRCRRLAEALTAAGVPQVGPPEAAAAAAAQPGEGPAAPLAGLQAEMAALLADFGAEAGMAVQLQALEEEAFAADVADMAAAIAAGG